MEFFIQIISSRPLAKFFIIFFVITIVLSKRGLRIQVYVNIVEFKIVWTSNCFLQNVDDFLFFFLVTVSWCSKWQKHGMLVIRCGIWSTMLWPMWFYRMQQKNIYRHQMLFWKTSVKISSNSNHNFLALVFGDRDAWKLGWNHCKSTRYR